MSTFLERLWYPQSPESAWRRLSLSPLTVAAAAFRAAVGVRGALFDRGLLRAHRVDARVVSIGNLNVGGAGKTPVTILVANRLHTAGQRVAVLSRGYGRTDRGPIAIAPGRPPPAVSSTGDEPLLIAQRCPAIPVLVGTDRVTLGRRAIEEYGATVLVLDDGLQHRRLARDVDIAVVDGSAQFGNGHLMPRGPLREPRSALRRASLACIRLSQEQPLPALDLPIPWFVTRYAPSAWLAPDGSEHPAAALLDQDVILITGVARPSSVEATLRALGARVQSTFAFRDHHAFTPRELSAVERAAGDLRIVTTEKDRVRLPSGFPAWTLRMDLRVEQGENLLDAALRAPT